jgi:chemotaxis protein histidine kinase CheA
VDAGKQQIVFYFIEEAKEHLETLQQGLLDLRSLMADPERVNEMFRAAHSVKGGAAMLGFDSIKAIAHRLEDCFSILKNHPVKADDRMESMFLKGYDALQVLVERLQGPFGLREDEAEKTVQEAEPNFIQLLAYLNALVSGGGSEDLTAAESNAPSIPADFAPQVTNVLRQMLQVFRQKESASNRQQLQTLCNQLLQLGVDLEVWQSLVQTAHDAIGCSQYSYRTLAPAVIKDLKQASDLLAAGHADAIAPSAILQELAAGANQIRIPIEPQAAAKALLQAFNSQQVSEIVALLQKAKPVS